MIYKRATAKLRAAGIEDIDIVKRLWGATPFSNTLLEWQTSQCFRTPEEAAAAVIAGFRPTQHRADESPVTEG